MVVRDVAFLERGACVQAQNYKFGVCIGSLMGVFMRVAIYVLGVVLSIAGSTSKAADTARGSVLTNTRPTAVLADRSFSVPYVSQVGADRYGSPGVYTHDSALRSAGGGVMGFMPSQNPASFALPHLPDNEPRREATARFNPANIPLPATRTLEDHLLTGFVALMLIAYQLRRKHRFLRPHQFST
jgi:hypothetical protein